MDIPHIKFSPRPQCDDCGRTDTVTLCPEHFLVEVRAHPEMAELRLQLKRQQAEMAELRKLKASLPKCWDFNAAGELVQETPVVPGMTVYGWHPVQIWEIQAWEFVQHRHKGRLVEWFIRLLDRSVAVASVAASPEAAEALMKQTQMEDTK